MRRQMGFTLIELMIVVVIIGIIVAVAYPAYNDQVRKARRAEAKSALQQGINRQERHYTNNNTYTTDMTDLGYSADPFITDKGWYSVTAAACGGATIAQCVELTAVPQKDQTNDSCGTLTFNSRGQSGASGSGSCW